MVRRTGLLFFSASELEWNLESFPCLPWTSDSLHLLTEETRSDVLQI